MRAATASQRAAGERKLPDGPARGPVPKTVGPGAGGAGGGAQPQRPAPGSAAAAAAALAALRRATGMQAPPAGAPPRRIVAPVLPTGPPGAVYVRRRPPRPPAPAQPPVEAAARTEEPLGLEWGELMSDRRTDKEEKALAAGPPLRPMDPVRLVAGDGGHTVMPYAEALAAARDAQQDLVCVQATASPPVYRLGSSSKRNYAFKVRGCSTRP